MGRNAFADLSQRHVCRLVDGSPTAECVDMWVPLGNFMNDWYAYHRDRRSDLVADPLPETYPPAMHRWATFCASAVEWFCARYDLPCPEWPMASRYTLSEPWFFHQQERAWQRLLTTTPEAFSRRNIYCGDRGFKNKYEISHPILLLSPQRASPYDA